MRHPLWLGLLILILTGCTRQYMAEQCHTGNAERIGQRDALAGRAARSPHELEALCQRYHASINFTEYQKGFTLAITDICQADKLLRWGSHGLAYPQGCHTLPNAKAYQQAWQRGWDWWIAQLDREPFRG